MANLFYRIRCAIKFGGGKYLLALVEDKLFKTSKRRTLTNEIIKKSKQSEREELMTYYAGIQTGQKVDLNNPKGFNEKILWYMANDSSDIKAELTDKYRVRKYVAERIGEEHLIPLVGTWKKFDDINFEELPKKFVLKCNHGSGWNEVIKDKSRISKEELKNKFDKWMSTSFAYNNFEMHYEKIVPLIVGEAYIEELDGNLYDYKVHCFNGKPRLIQVIGNRDFEHHTGFQKIYDLNWNAQSYTMGPYPLYEKDIKKPEVLNQLLSLSEKLSEDFEYVRTDFYIIDNKILFGELTFTPGGGLYKYDNCFTRKEDLLLGGMININVK